MFVKLHTHCQNGLNFSTNGSKKRA
jgi:hypothetical protein